MNNQLTVEELTAQLSLPEGMYIKQFVEADFPYIQRLYEKEGWMTFINREADAIKAWKNSSIGLVVFHGEEVVGLLRGLTDGEITTYIAEIVIDNSFRGNGIGKALLTLSHNLYPNTRLVLLAADGADEFYEKSNFRKSTGFRKSSFLL